MKRHNIKPELLPELVGLLKETTQAKKRLRIGDCMCFEGVCCEIYRRHRPDKARWETSSSYEDDLPGTQVFVVRDDEYGETRDRMRMPIEVRRFFAEHDQPLIDGQLPWKHNDGFEDTLEKSFEDFIAILQEA